MASRRGTYKGVMPTEIYAVAYPVGKTGRHIHRLYEQERIVKGILTRWEADHKWNPELERPLVFQAVITGWESVEPPEGEPR